MGSLAVVAPSRLESLPARPPTPPREAKTKLTVNPRQPWPPQPLDPKPSIHTPPNVFAPSSPAASSSRRKKVEFSAQAEYREPPLYLANENARQHPTPVSNPPSSSASLPVKSILKVSLMPVPNPLEPTSDARLDGIGLAAMLESTVQQLAGGDRDLKVDAYVMLIRALKASNNLPDRIALQRSMSLFMQFIQRDMTSKTASGSPDASLVNQACTLLSTFLAFSAIASTLSAEFCVFVIEHCIKSLQDEAIPKDMARKLMQVLALQNFPPRVMTSDRVGKLVTALHNLPGHIQDRKGVYMGRIAIYRVLLRRSRPHMVQHTDWLPDLFEGMLSGIKEIRSAAIGLGIDVGFLSIKEKRLSVKAMELLAQPAPSQDAIDYAQYYASVLRGMMEDKEKLDSRFVPQIWSVVFLLIRGPDRWVHFNEWLKIIQACFNSSDFQTKYEACYGWCRMGYAMLAHDRMCSPKFASTLFTPLASLARRRGSGKNIDELRTVAFGSICTLYYYVFRPAISTAHLDRYWDMWVKPVMDQLAEPRPDDLNDDCTQACTVLTSLFDSSVRRIWNEERIVEGPQTLPEELPALDAKWLRHNAARVFGVVEPILKRKYYDLCNTRSDIFKLWQALIGTAALAASKEIKVSQDMAAFLGHAFGVLLRVWTRGMHPPEAGGHGRSVQFLASAREFILVMVDKLGRLPFTEKVLAKGTGNQPFVPLATPSHRSGGPQQTSRPTLHHLFSILSTLPPGVPDNGEFTEFFKSIFASFLHDRDARSRRRLALEMMQMIPMDALCPAGPWVLAAEAISSTHESSQKSSSQAAPSSSGDPSVGQEYRDVVKVLERGLRSTPNLPWQCWHSLFCSLRDRIRADAGDAGLAIVLTEPLAKVLLDQVSEKTALPTHTLAAFGEVLSACTQPRDRQAVDAARRRLWGTDATGPRCPSFDPFENIYRLCNAVLGRLYRDFDQYDPESTAVSVLNELSAFLSRCNHQLLVQTLVLLQEGVAPWIQDSETKLNGRQFPKATEATRLLWDQVCVTISTIQQEQVFSLAAFETLLCAAFESKHRHVVNSVSTMWNTAFDKAVGVVYPDRLKAVLLSRQPFVDIVLPGLDASSAEFSAQRPTFIDSQLDMEVLNTCSTALSKSTGPITSSGSGAKKHDNPKRETTKSGRSHDVGVTKASLSAKGRKKSVLSPPRLRHDDSQIQFATIESSPANDKETLESQVLTDRQREVRDRQREVASMFPDIRSSSPGIEETGNGVSGQRSASPDAQRLPDIGSPGLPRATTPKGDNRFEAYVSSTPTPRRGHPPSIVEGLNEASDPPSSPPEPRRYPLLPHLKARASSDSLLDDTDWDFSSPISGSPHPTRHRDPVAMVPTEEDGHMVVDETEYGLQTREEAAQAAHHDGPTPAPELGHDSAGASVEEAVSAPKTGPVSRSAAKATGEEPTTPRHNLRPRAPAESPKSDDSEVFVDALATPQPPSSPTKATEQADALDSSYMVSDGEERSLIRMVVQLDGKKQKPTNFIKGTPSPDKAAASPHRRSDSVPSHAPAAEPAEESQADTEDCITVAGANKPTRGRPGRSRKIKPDEASTVALSPIAGRAGSSPELTPSGRHKRKRSASKTERDSTSPKKTKTRDVKHRSEAGAEQVSTSRFGPSNQASLPSIAESREIVHAQHVDRAAPPPSPVDLPCSTSTNDMDIDPEAENREVESQIALEQAEMTSRSRSRSKRLALTEPSSSEITATPEKAQKARQGPQEEAGEHMHKEPSPGLTAPSGTRGESASPLETIMAMLKGGLGALKATSLSRDEVYEIEELFMDIKHELYAAEKRGRK